MRKTAVCACALALLAGCATRGGEKNTLSLFAMDTYMSLSAYNDEGGEALDAAAEELRRLEALLSVTNEGSDIYALNHSGGTTVELSPETAELIELSIEISDETHGAFDATLYPITSEWGFTTGNFTVPSDERLCELMKLTGSDKISLDGNTATLEKGTQLDLGGIAKGYAGKKAALLLKESGVSSALLDMGGNIQTIGSKPDGSDWNVGIKDPLDSAKLVGTVSVSDKAVVTSGGYERYFEQGGTLYSHIIDPKTGRPAKNGTISATVIGNDGAICDGLSTALFVMTRAEAKDILSQHTDISAVIVSDDGSLLVSAALKGNFTPTDDYKEAEIEWV